MDALVSLEIDSFRRNISNALSTTKVDLLGFARQRRCSKSKRAPPSRKTRPITQLRLEKAKTPFCEDRVKGLSATPLRRGSLSRSVCLCLFPVSLLLSPPKLHPSPPPPTSYPPAMVEGLELIASRYPTKAALGIRGRGGNVI